MDRQELYTRLPIQAAASWLYDGDVVLDHRQVFLTVIQAWHGADGITARCIEGAHRLSDAGPGFAYPHPVQEFTDDDGPILLTGSLDTDQGLRLDSLAPLGGPPVAGIVRWAPSISAGDLIVAADGRVYEVHVREGVRALVRAWNTADSGTYTGFPVEDYLASAPLAPSGFAVIRPKPA